MRRVFAFFFCILTFIILCEGGSLSTLKEPSRCGDWMPYKDEKCLNVASRTGHQTQEDAEIICESYSEGGSNPKLLTIKSKEEQEFVQDFLFTKNNMKNNVWLGLKEIGSTGKFEWNDGSEVLFSNWLNQSVSDNVHHCVEMKSGGGVHSAGVWARVTCEKENVVVCERTQTWALETLQKAFIQYRVELEAIKKSDEESKQEIDKLKLANAALEQKTKDCESEIQDLKRNPVPIGFIYIQLPHQDSPTLLWPATEWTEVSSNYSGLFFRVTGGNAAMFGQIQESSSPKLKDVTRSQNNSGTAQVDVPPDGSWSNYIWSGTSGNNVYNVIRFRVSSEEVRPRNKAVKIWQRTR